MINQGGKLTREMIYRGGIESRSLKMGGDGEQLTLRKNAPHTHMLLKMMGDKENRESLNCARGNQSVKSMVLGQTVNNHKTYSKQTMQKPSQQQKMEQLKDRFRKIKSSYQQNHQKINFNLINDYQKNTSMGQNETTRLGDTTEFSISQGEMTFNHQDKRADCSFQSRGYNGNDSRVNVNESGFNRNVYEESQQNINTQPQRSIREGAFEQDNNRSYGSGGRSTATWRSQKQLEQKYRSLSKQLQGFDQEELIGLLIEEIEDNEKNKHAIQLKSEEVDKLRRVVLEGKQQIDRLNKLMQRHTTECKNNTKQKQANSHNVKLKQELRSFQEGVIKKQEEIEKMRGQVERVKRQVESKKEQIEVLLETERRNLGIIQRLKKASNKGSSVNNIGNVYSSKSQTIEREVQTMSMMNEQRNSQSLECSSVIHKQPSLITIQRSMTTSSLTTSTNNSEDYRQKHDELQQYMNEYIQHVNEAYQEYKRRIHQLKEQNGVLREENLNLKRDLDKVKERYKCSQGEVQSIKMERQRLAACMANSKQVITELEEEFCHLKDLNSQLKEENNMLKDQNNQLKLTVSQREQQVTNLNSKLLQSQHELNLLAERNQQLLNQNYQLTQDVEEIRDRVIGNQEVEGEIRLIVEGLERDQLDKQRIIEEKERVIDQLKGKLRDLSEIIQGMQSQIEAKNSVIQHKDRQIKNKELKITQIQEQLTFTQRKLQLTIQSNQVLQKTTTQLTALLTELLVEYQKEKERHQLAKNQLVQMMDSIKSLFIAYEWQTTQGESIRQMLQLYWQRHDTASLYNQNDMKSILQQSQSSNSNSEQISFKKSSKLTKQGSSPIFSKIQHSEQNKTSSKSSLWKNSSIDSQVVDGSLISHRYYSQTQEEEAQDDVLKLQAKGNLGSLRDIGSTEDRRCFDKKCSR